MLLPRADYDDVDTVRQISENLRNLAVKLNGRELKFRRGETVSPLGVGFAHGADEETISSPTDLSRLRLSVSSIATRFKTAIGLSNEKERGRY